MSRMRDIAIALSKRSAKRVHFLTMVKTFLGTGGGEVLDREGKEGRGERRTYFTAAQTFRHFSIL